MTQAKAQLTAYIHRHNLNHELTDDELSGYKVRFTDQVQRLLKGENETADEQNNASFMDRWMDKLHNLLEGFPPSPYQTNGGSVC